MSIPKLIHYCWFGNNNLPELAEKCIETWKQICPDYEIVLWNEDNFRIADCPKYVQEAYNHKKYAFVADYARLKILYLHGGIYLDTDVEMLKRPDALREHKAYFGIQGDLSDPSELSINTGLGFGAEKGLAVLSELMAWYENARFVYADGTMNLKPCPEKETPVLISHGFKQVDELQVLQDDILILPSEVLCPKDYKTGTLHMTEQTISIHHCAASWHDGTEAAGNSEYIKRRTKRIKRIKKILRRLKLEKIEQFAQEMYHRYKK